MDGLILLVAVLVVLLAYAAGRIVYLKRQRDDLRQERGTLDHVLGQAVEELVRRAQAHERRNPRLTSMPMGELHLEDLRPTDEERGISRIRNEGPALFRISRILEWDGSVISTDWEVEA